MLSARLCVMGGALFLMMPLGWIAADEPSVSDALREEHAALSRSMGRSAEAQYQLALWCEQRGLSAERDRHVTWALLADKDHAGARALRGQVWHDGAWTDAQEVRRAVSEDAALRDWLETYEHRRAGTPMSPQDQWELALWCEEHGHPEQARAHLETVIRLDPRSEKAWKKLGYKQHDGRWMTSVQIEEARSQTIQQEKANGIWKKRLGAWLEELRDFSKAPQVLERLARVEDPLAVPAVVNVLGKQRPELAVQVLGQIDDPASSRALAYLALNTNSAEARRAAAETLFFRDPREFAGPLIAMIRTPLKYEVRAVVGAGRSGVLYVEGAEFDLERVYRVEAPPRIPARIPQPEMGEVLVQGADGLPYFVRADLRTGITDPAVVDLSRSLQAQPQQAAQLIEQFRGRSSQSSATYTDFPTWSLFMAQDGSSMVTRGWRPAFDEVALRNLERARQAVQTAQQRMEFDILVIESTNRQIQSVNEPVLGLLKNATGKDLGADSEAWQAWWLDALGLQLQRSDRSKVLMSEVVQIEAGYDRSHSCFAAGTPVHTLRGMVRIETIEVGDLVLSQDVQTGALRYQPVTAALQNPPSETYRVQFGEHGITSSPFHRFWMAGKGWVMARDLSVGDRIRSLGGVITVDAIERGAKQDVFNLVVADDHSFFVGDAALLVHDNALPSLRIEPFDRPGELAREETPAP